MELRKYGLYATSSESYEDTLEAVKRALQAEGFGVLTEIDVKNTLKQKLNIDFRRYDIIGACNPPLAYQALTNELDIGLLLPCNVIVYEDQSGGCTVAALDPEQMMGVTGNPALNPVAAQARERLWRALSSIDAN